MKEEEVKAKVEELLKKQAVLRQKQTDLEVMEKEVDDDKTLTPEQKSEKYLFIAKKYKDLNKLMDELIKEAEDLAEKIDA